MLINWLLILSVLALVPIIWDRMNYVFHFNMEREAQWESETENGWPELDWQHIDYVRSMTNCHRVSRHDWRKRNERMALPLGGDNVDDCD